MGCGPERTGRARGSFSPDVFCTGNGEVEEDVLVEVDEVLVDVTVVLSGVDRGEDVSTSPSSSSFSSSSTSAETR